MRAIAPLIDEVTHNGGDDDGRFLLRATMRRYQAQNRIWGF